MDAALQGRLDSGESPFDGVTLAMDYLPAEEIRLALTRIVPVLARSTDIALRTYLDWWDHDGVVSQSEPASWSELLESLSDPHQFLKSSPYDDVEVRRAWYPEDFSFLLRWWTFEEDFGPHRPHGPLLGFGDITVSGALIDEVCRVAEGFEVAPARRWFYDKSAHEVRRQRPPVLGLLRRRGFGSAVWRRRR